MDFADDSRFNEYMKAVHSTIKILNESCSGMEVKEKYNVCSFDVEIIQNTYLNIVENLYNQETGLVETYVGYSVDLKLFSTQMPDMAMRLGLYIGNWLKNSPSIRN